MNFIYFDCLIEKVYRRFKLIFNYRRARFKFNILIFSKRCKSIAKKVLLSKQIRLLKDSNLKPPLAPPMPVVSHTRSMATVSPAARSPDAKGRRY